MHYGGHFEEIGNPATLVYTGKTVSVFEDWDIDYINVQTLFKMYQSSNDGLYAKLYYQVPYTDLDVGVVSIENDVDIELLITAYKGLNQMHIYAEKGDDPL